jgi:hypothetical protein
VAGGDVEQTMMVENENQNSRVAPWVIERLIEYNQNYLSNF